VALAAALTAGALLVGGVSAVVVLAVAGFALLRRVAEGDMPPEGEAKRPGKDEVALLRRWVEAGAPDFNPALPPRTFVSPAEVARAIRDDLGLMRQMGAL